MFNIFTSSIDTAIIVLPLMMALTVGGTIILVGYILADVPASQVMRTFAKFGAGSIVNKGFFNKVLDRKFNNEKDADKQQALDNKINMVNIWCKRLNKTTSYDEIMRQGNQILMISAVLFAICFFAGIVIGEFVICIIGVFMILVGAIFPTIQISSLHGQIKKLNKSILFELPILASEFAEIMPTGRNVEKIFEDYLTQAGAIRQDIELTLADFKHMTKYAALAEMSNRIQAGDRVEEIGQLIDMLKSSANIAATSQNLQQLSNRIHLLYVAPFVIGKRESKLMALQACIGIIIVLVIFLYVSPTLIQLVQSMGEVL